MARGRRPKKDDSVAKSSNTTVVAEPSSDEEEVRFELNLSRKSMNRAVIEFQYSDCRRQATFKNANQVGPLTTVLRIGGESFSSPVTQLGLEHLVTTSYMKNVSSYVMQDDQLFPMLTVLEMLMFVAEFRLSPAISGAEKMTQVWQLLEQLSWQTVANTYIGMKGGEGCQAEGVDRN